jgi:hypothetical protein
LKVELRQRPEVAANPQITYRTAYYVPASTR